MLAGRRSELLKARNRARRLYGVRGAEDGGGDRVQRLQVSPRYKSGMALRFARVKRYRTDKTAGEADTLETVRKLAWRFTMAEVQNNRSLTVTALQNQSVAEPRP